MNRLTLSEKLKQGDLNYMNSLLCRSQKDTIVQHVSTDQILVSRWTDSSDLLDYLIVYLLRKNKKKNFPQRINLNFNTFDQGNQVENQLSLTWLQNFRYPKSLVFGHLTFNNIQKLSIRNSIPLNCQIFSFMDFPSLKQLQIQSNNISNYKPLIKGKLNSLEFFQIDQRIRYQISLERQKLNQDMKQIYLESYWTLEPFKNDFSFLAKIPNVKLKLIHLKGDSRIEQKKVLQVLSKKLPQMKYNLRIQLNRF